MEEPKRAKLLMDSDDARCVESMTDRENKEPNREIPNTEIVDPKRHMPRKERAEPICV
jgi:hypothetical protein